MAILKPEYPLRPLRKPQRNGKPLSLKQIHTLDGRKLDVFVCICVMSGFFTQSSDTPPIYTLYPGGDSNGENFAERGWGVTQAKAEAGGKRQHDWDGIPRYSSDIAAAFTVNRPDWCWSMREHRRQVWYYVVLESGRQFTGTVHCSGRPTLADHAKARCYAALALALFCGE